MPNPIIAVEFPKPPKPEPVRPKTLYEIHPLPWEVGETNMAKSDILDANGDLIATVKTGLCGSMYTAERIVNVFNAFHGIEP